MACIRFIGAFLGITLVLASSSALLVSCGPSRADCDSPKDFLAQTADGSSLRAADDLTAQASEWAVIEIESKRRHDRTWMAQERLAGGYDSDDFALVGPFHCYTYSESSEMLEVDESELFYLIVNGHHAFGFVGGSLEGSSSGETGGGLYVDFSNKIGEYGSLIGDDAGCFLLSGLLDQAGEGVERPLVMVGVAGGQCVVAREPFRRWDEPSEALMGDIRFLCESDGIDLQHERFPLDVSEEYLVVE